MGDAGMPRGYSFGGEKARRVASNLARQARENARRIPCMHCSLTILPENLSSHIVRCHGDVPS